MADSDDLKETVAATSSIAGSGKSVTTMNALAKFDIGDIAIQQYFNEHKHEANFSSTIIETGTGTAPPSTEDKELNVGGPGDTVLGENMDPVTRVTGKTHGYEKKPVSGGFSGYSAPPLPANLLPSQRVEEVTDYLHNVNDTYRTREDYEMFAQGKLAVAVTPKMKSLYEEQNKAEVLRSKRRFIVFLVTGGLLIAIGLSLVLYTYTLHYKSSVRISGATLLNMGLLLEIFTVAGWNGGTF